MTIGIAETTLVNSNNIDILMNRGNDKQQR